MSDIKVFIQKMSDSGYDKATRGEILKSGLKRYYRLRLQEEAGCRRLYRSGQDLQQGRTLKPMKVRDWFKPQRGGRKVSNEKDYPTLDQEDRDLHIRRRGRRHRTQEEEVEEGE